MSIAVADDLLAPIYRFCDPSALIACDNPHCAVPWLTGAGFVSWRVGSIVPTGSFTDCLAQAQRTHMTRNVVQWSAPMPVRDWLEALRRSLDCDPATTEIGAFCS